MGVDGAHVCCDVSCVYLATANEKADSEQLSSHSSTPVNHAKAFYQPHSTKAHQQLTRLATIDATVTVFFRRAEGVHRLQFMFPDSIHPYRLPHAWLISPTAVKETILGKLQ